MYLTTNNIVNPETNEVIVDTNTMITKAIAKKIVESGIKEDFDLFMEGKFINDRMFSNEKLGGMIYTELYANPDLSDIELGKSVYSKLKLYFDEIK